MLLTVSGTLIAAQLQLNKYICIHTHIHEPICVCSQAGTGASAEAEAGHAPLMPEIILPSMWEASDPQPEVSLRF